MNEKKKLQDFREKIAFEAQEKIAEILKKYTEDTFLQVKKMSIDYHPIGGLCHGEVNIDFIKQKDIFDAMEDYYDYRASKR